MPGQGEDPAGTGNDGQEDGTAAPNPGVDKTAGQKAPDRHEAGRMHRTVSGLLAVCLTALLPAIWLPAMLLPATARAQGTDLSAALAAPDAAATEGGATAATGAGPLPRLGPETGFPLPRFVSLGTSEANARRGPSRSHRIDWVFTRRAMPVMVVAEHGHWRRVVDRDGAGGWMHYSLLSGERTALVEVDMLPLYARPDAASPVRAYAELGVTGALAACQPGWCLLEVAGYRGWVDTDGIWGVEPGEVFD